MYHHEQVGRFYLATGGLLVIPLAIGFVARIPFLVWFALGFALMYWAFARLRVDVRNGDTGTPELRWAMTFGWPRGRIPIADVAHAQIVPVTFWMGIGIHLTMRGWVWNVSLGRGVQIDKTDGANIVLGTDDAEGLLSAIARAR
jgi:hypothetical protein